MTLEAARLSAYSAPGFRSRVEFCLVSTALAVTTEWASAPLHAERIALARRILDEPEAYVTRFALAVLADPELLAAENCAAIGDDTLRQAIGRVYNSFTQGDPGALAEAEASASIASVPRRLLGIFPVGGGTA